MKTTTGLRDLLGVQCEHPDSDLSVRTPAVEEVLFLRVSELAASNFYGGRSL